MTAVDVTTTLEVKDVTTHKVHDDAVTVVLPVSELERQCGLAVSELERQCGYYKTKCKYYQTKCQALEQSVRHTTTTFQRKHAERELRCTVSLRRMRNQVEVLEQARVRYLANTQTTITALEAQIQHFQLKNQLLVLQPPPPPPPPSPPLSQHDNGTINNKNKSIVDVNDLEIERVTDMDDQREEEEEKEEKRNHSASRTNSSTRKYSYNRNTTSRTTKTTTITSTCGDDDANCREGMMLVVPFSRGPVAVATATATVAVNHHHTYQNRSSHSRNIHRKYSSSSSSSRPPFLVPVHEEEEEKEKEDTCSDSSSSSSSSSSSWQFNLISSSLSSSYGIF